MVAGDLVIRPLFGGDLANGRDQTEALLGRVAGRTGRYRRIGLGGLYQHHEDLPVTRSVVERWLDHLSAALDDAIPNQADAADILQRARKVALELVNLEHEPSNPGAGTSRHRSAQIASCGVGARTVKQAVLLAERGRVEELAALVAAVSGLVERALFAAQLLQSAALAGRIAVVEWLLDQGVDPAALCRQGRIRGDHAGTGRTRRRYGRARRPGPDTAGLAGAPV